MSIAHMPIDMLRATGHDEAGLDTFSCSNRAAKPCEPFRHHRLKFVAELRRQSTTGRL